MKISAKNAVFLSLALFCVFVLGTAVFYAARSGRSFELSCRFVPKDVLMQGRDDADSNYIELIPGQRVDINLADSRQLQKLPGIGDVLSEEIIRHRQTEGLFESPEDIMQIEGIGEKGYAQLEEYIFVGESYENTGS